METQPWKEEVLFLGVNYFVLVSLLKLIETFRAWKNK